VPMSSRKCWMDGDHDIDRCVEVTTWVLKETFQQLFYNRRRPRSMVLKPNMGGARQEVRASKRPWKKVADKTLRVRP